MPLLRQVGRIGFGKRCNSMIAFCTHCWKETDSHLDQCPACGASLSADTRSYGEKLIGALNHPLPEARLRICWLIGENRVQEAVPALMRMVEHDPDLFVQRAALEALGDLRDPRAIPLLAEMSGGSNRFLANAARKSLEKTTVG